ncbi:P-loop containing nucleoside triphosphate hydrolase protein [Hyaloraphidium curvatum]|nr:P-loop containing nucleoside triphosphate hydrolase protein [Hyaloraphidium curvatum]
MPITIIGAGLHRTGTLSLHAALGILGLRSHHSYTMCFPPLDVPGLGPVGQRFPDGLRWWMDAFAGKFCTREDYDAYFRDEYDAAVDVSYAWDSIHAAYPDARVILTVRDPESWWDSYRTMLAPLNTLRMTRAASEKVPGRPVTAFDFAATYLSSLFALDEGGRFGRARGIRLYHEYAASIKARVPADRLLEFDPAGGWAPLCAFLGVPVPDVPYPRINERGFMADLTASILAQYEGWLGKPFAEIAREFAWRPGVDYEEDWEEE